MWGEVDKKALALALDEVRGMSWRPLGVDSDINFVSKSEHCTRLPRVRQTCPPSPCTRPFALSVLAGPVSLGHRLFSGITVARPPGIKNDRKGRISRGELCSKPDPLSPCSQAEVSLLSPFASLGTAICP